MNPRSPTFKSVPLDIVGSTVFGRYPKISSESTYNMIISDDWLVPYAGYKKVSSINSSGKGRAIFRSAPLNAIFAVINNAFYLINTNLTPNFIGNIDTFVDEAFIDEDEAGNIAICDKKDIWIYNNSAGSFYRATTDGTTPLDFTPGYVAFHDGRFLSVDLNAASWRLSQINGSGKVIFPNDSQHQQSFNTKGDRPVAAIPLPGKGNNILVLGSISGQFWNDVGASLFPYQRLSSVNLDYGTVNSATIAASEEVVCWVAQNSKSGPFIVYSEGGPAVKISTDGIDFKLSQLTAPQDSFGFIFKQDGHLFYQVTFKTDNQSYIYDFNTKRFFTVTDPYMNYHIAHHVAFLNNKYYFVSANDGNLYEIGTNYTNYDGQEIPRIRITKTLRMQDTTPFVTNNMSFPLEQGATSDIARVDLSISNDGGATFGNFDGMQLNALGNRQNRFLYNNLGWGNEITFQFRFYSNGRFVAGNGMTSIYQ